MPRLQPPSTNPKTLPFAVLAKMRGSRTWQEVSNPYTSDSAECYAVKTLDQHWSIEYIEWINSGVVYRVIRRCSVGAYRLE